MNIQTDDGLNFDADAYVDSTYVVQYWAGRGVVLEDNDKLSAAIVAATDYLDNNFRYVGDRLQGRQQRTEWPRKNAYDVEGYIVQGIPREIKEATAEYVKRVVVDGTDLSGTEQKSLVKQVVEEIGPIKESITYLSGHQQQSLSPIAENKLKNAGLLRSPNRKQIVGNVGRG